jgi:thiol:disulfide interchange protein DsbA
MRRIAILLAGLLCAATAGAQTWTEGKNYFVIEPRQSTSVEPGKIEVIEVFSYGCPACNAFVPTAEKMKASLPPNAVMTYLPASFIPTEGWPMFQRAFFAAKALNIVDRTHNKMFDAVWGSGELSVVDRKTNRLKNPLPSIEDASKFYARVGGVKAEDFVSAAKSFGVEAQMRRADMLIKDAYKVPSTPTIIVNGRYRLDGQTAGGSQQLIDLTNWLVAKETQAKK